MSSVYQKRGVWYLCIKSASGKWINERSHATTKTEAKRLASERERAERELRHQRIAAPNFDPSMRFADLIDFWWREYGVNLRSHHIKGSVDKHVTPALGHLPLLDVTGGQIEALLNSKVKKLAPDTINRLRFVIHRVFAVAIRRGLWIGANPAANVPKHEVTKRKPEFLRKHEVPQVLQALPAQWRPLFATAALTGLRKGELLGLRKSDVDLESGTLTVGHSYEQPRTKGNTVVDLPITDQLRPFLVEALRVSPSEYLFPADDGAMMTRDAPLDHILRRALAAAKIATHFEHRCRGRRCGYKEKAADETPRYCPKCKTTRGPRELWAVPIPRHVRFHDLRHTTATLLLKAGVPFATVAKIMRHSNPRVTTDIYGHLDLEDMREGLERFPVQLDSVAGPSKEV